MSAEVHTNTHTHTHTHAHTRAHAHAGTHENDVEYACSKFMFPVQANARISKHIHGHTFHMRTPIHTHAAARTRTTSSMHYPNPRFRFKQMPAEAQ